MGGDIWIRAAHDDDASGLIRLVGGCFDEYPGCVLAVDAEMPYLRQIATYYAALAGRFWIAELDGAVVGSIGTHPVADGDWELRTLYVDPRARRRGLASRLCDAVEHEARRNAARGLELWSDTRFEAAHALYTERGFARGPETRELHDLSKTVEYYFRKALPA